MLRSVILRLSLLTSIILGSLATIAITGCGEDAGAPRGSVETSGASKGVMAESKDDAKDKSKRRGGPPAGPKNFKSLNQGANN